MSRKPRFNLPGVPQHVIQCGHNREPCFYAEADYHRYRHDLGEAAEKNQASIHAYVLMTNHVWLTLFSVDYSMNIAWLRRLHKFCGPHPVFARFFE